MTEVVATAKQKYEGQKTIELRGGHESRSSLLEIEYCARLSAPTTTLAILISALFSSQCYEMLRSSARIPNRSRPRLWVMALSRLIRRNPSSFMAADIARLGSSGIGNTFYMSSVRWFPNSYRCYRLVSGRRGMRPRYEFPFRLAQIN
jgi:hypothetical protein